MKNQHAIRFVEVTRDQYWFGHRAANLLGAPGSQTPSSKPEPYVLRGITSAPVYGIAIADQSEVRGVRLGVFDQGESLPGPVGWQGPYLELVEGEPLALETRDDPTFYLDRLD